ncbi:MAG: SDR family oxidoreductase [Acidobacteria bacterium]|nr:SDR family oxidoreductase [Acidobacteriota bacterium]
MLQHQVVVITGASSGIGAAAALALAQRGARLCLLARSADRLAEVAEAARKQGAVDVFWQSCDVRDEAAVNDAITAAHERFGRIDALINSAGLSLNGAVNGYALDDWRTVIETNLTGTFLCCRAVLPLMMEQAAHPLRGQIVNLSSGAGRNGIKHMAAYCAAKFGVIGFTESLAHEVRNDDIRVSVLLPASTATNFSRVARRAEQAESSDIGYALTAEEVAEVIVAMLAQPPQAWMSEVVLRPLNLERKR